MLIGKISVYWFKDFWVSNQKNSRQELILNFKSERII
jgi:hypothetical protein